MIYLYHIQYLTLYRINMTYNLKKSIIQWESVCICICLHPRRGSLSALCSTVYVNYRVISPIHEGLILHESSHLKFHKNTNLQYLFGIFIAGPSKIDVTYEEIPIPESPFQVTAAPGCDASRVRAYGPGMCLRYFLVP